MPKANNEAEEVSKDIVVDAVPEPKEETQVEIVKAEEPSQPRAVSAEEGVQELKRRLQDAENARQRAERERNEAVQRAYRADNEKAESDRLFIDSTANQVKSNLSILETSYADAITAGDALRAAKIAREMAANEAKLLQLENGAQALKERPKEPPRPLDPVEAFASQLSPRSAAWIRSHPDYVLNPKLQQKMVAAHNMALADDVQADTDDYFRYVEERLGINKDPSIQRAGDDDNFSEASKPRGRQPSAIPPSRDPPSHNGQRQRVVRLSAEEAEMASLMGMEPADYWKYKQELRSEGKLN